eukprot:TRINITY_DN15255_c0_g1_i1.p1 TRINITY_DN15255_c0_g1~~TRINITY_DN15255_c0_g1_i1.p1  ORF type:complete len:331 (+),score=29.23 TRINITY_DN15255_c0_g1_i1:36-1028(+)
MRSNAFLCLIACASGCTPMYDPGTHFITAHDDGTLGNDRQFLLIVPSGLSVGVRVPAVLGIHGYSSNPYYWGTLVSFEQNVQRYGWLGVLPFGTAKVNTTVSDNRCCPAGVSAQDCYKALDKSNPCSFNAGGCCADASATQVKDVAFARYIAKWLVANVCADEGSLFVTGFSNGGMMANRIGCEASDVFAAVAPVAGAVVPSAEFPSCRPTHKISWISYCGSQDDVCDMGDGFQRTAGIFGQANQCVSTEVNTYTTATTTCSRYACSGVTVEWCTVHGLTHEWSGHERPDTPLPQPATNPDCTRYIFDKFSLSIGARSPQNKLKAKLPNA